MRKLIKKIPLQKVIGIICLSLFAIFTINNLFNKGDGEYRAVALGFFCGFLIFVIAWAIELIGYIKMIIKRRKDGSKDKT